MYFVELCNCKDKMKGKCSKTSENEKCMTV